MFLVGSFFFFLEIMKACSFFGHRDTPQTEELKQKVREAVERLIVEEGVDTFLFGSRSKFDELCHVVVTELKEKYTIVMVTHNMQQAARIADKTAFFLLGEVIEYGDTEQLFSMPKDKRCEDYITGRFG